MISLVDFMLWFSLPLVAHRISLGHFILVQMRQQETDNSEKNTDGGKIGGLRKNKRKVP